MKYTKEERLDIGRQIYDGEISKNEASEAYGISPSSAREYMRLYRDCNHLPPKNQRQGISYVSSDRRITELYGIADYESMSKEELLRELMKAKIAEARLKKGYEVKGDGSIILYDNKNIK